MENETVNTNTQTVASAEDANNTAASTETVDVEALKAKAAKADELEATNRQLFERANKAEGFVKVGDKWVKAPKPEEAVATSEKLAATTGELTETQLDYLDLKGISNEDDIAIIQKVMQRTGQTVRQALADDYVQSKLEAAKKAREVQAAMPSGTKRSGGNASDSVELALAKFDATGEMPKEFGLRKQIVAKITERSNPNKPAWH